jgi:hypothetical protein
MRTSEERLLRDDRVRIERSEAARPRGEREEQV